ncbi:hypothetical protein THAOC_32227, partial [Thalassiosira oceanica]
SWSFEDRDDTNSSAASLSELYVRSRSYPSSDRTVAMPDPMPPRPACDDGKRAACGRGCHCGDTGPDNANCRLEFESCGSGRPDKCRSKIQDWGDAVILLKRKGTACCGNSPWMCGRGCPEAEESPPQPSSSAAMDVLTVGDGDLSFSLALQRAYPAALRVHPSTLVATREELVSTYPDSARVVDELERPDKRRTAERQVRSGALQSPAPWRPLAGGGRRGGTRGPAPRPPGALLSFRKVGAQSWRRRPRLPVRDPAEFVEGARGRGTVRPGRRGRGGHGRPGGALDLRREEPMRCAGNG